MYYGVGSHGHSLKTVHLASGCLEENPPGTLPVTHVVII